MDIPWRPRKVSLTKLLKSTVTKVFILKESFFFNMKYLISTFQVVKSKFKIQIHFNSILKTNFPQHEICGRVDIFKRCLSFVLSSYDGPREAILALEL